MNNSKNDIREIGREQGLNNATILDSIETIKLGMFYTHYRLDAEKPWEIEYNERIKAAFKRYRGVEFSEDLCRSIKEKGQKQFVALMGPPGHGKTTAFKQAAKWFAKETGLKFMDRFNIDKYLQKGEPIPRDTYMFVSHEFSGEVSKSTLAIPMKTSGNLNVSDNDGTSEKAEMTYMANVMPVRFAVLNQVAAGTILLDDFVNASPNLQNMALSITNEQRFQDMEFPNAYVGITGNLGSIDGTNTSKMSSALASRVQVRLVSDTVEDFINRLQAETKDEYGDLGISGFLRRNPEYFWSMPGQTGGFNCPRTWDATVSEARVVFQANGNDLEKSLQEISASTPSMLGLEVSKFFNSYLYAMAKGADPLAKKMIERGEWNKQEEEKFKSSMNGSGMDSKSIDFSAQLAVALADHATYKIVSHPKQPELCECLERMKEIVKSEPENYSGRSDKAEYTQLEAKAEELIKEIVRVPMERFAKGLKDVVNQEPFGFGLDHMIMKITNQLPAWTEERKSKSSSTKRLSPTPLMSLTKTMVAIANENPDFNVDSEKLGQLLGSMVRSTGFSATNTSVRRKRNVS